EGAAIASLISERDIMSRAGLAGSPGSPLPSSSASGPSDILARLDLLAEAEATRFAGSLRNRGLDLAAARQVVRLRDALLRAHRNRRAGTEHGMPAGDTDSLLKWLLAAYPDRVVKRRGAPGTGVMVGGRGVRLGTQSVVKAAEFFVAIDARQERRGG